jgi:hypothetical protein
MLKFYDIDSDTSNWKEGRYLLLFAETGVFEGDSSPFSRAGDRVWSNGITDFLIRENLCLTKIPVFIR